MKDFDECVLEGKANSLDWCWRGEGLWVIERTPAAKPPGTRLQRMIGVKDWVMGYWLCTS